MERRSPLQKRLGIHFAAGMSHYLALNPEPKTLYLILIVKPKPELQYAGRSQLTLRDRVAGQRGA